MAASPAADEWVRASAGGVRFGVRAKVRASKSAVLGVRDGEVLVAVAAPPVEGAANAEIAETIAEVLHVPKRSVAIVAGAKSKSKVIEVSGVTVDEVRERLLPKKE